jgi:hypothetical protein
MNINEQTVAIELNVGIARNQQALAVALERLYSNKDFQAVVTNGYFREEAVRLVMARGSAEMQTPERQASLQAEIDAVSRFSGYLDTVRFFGDQAKKSIEDGEAELEMIRTGGN